MNFTPTNYHDPPQPIIKKYNGRINIAEPDNPMATFHMFERIAVNNKATEYRDALVGESEWNQIADVYFSADNIQRVQNGLKVGVYQKSEGKFVIAPQNIDFLKIIMRSIYMQHVEHTTEDVATQVERLNGYVLDQVVPKLYSECIGYFKYLQDQSSLAVPLDLPQRPDRVYKSLELKPWF
jgi:hypothetical protein